MAREVALFVDESVQSEIEIFASNDICSFEHDFVQITPTSFKPLLVGSFHRPPNSDLPKFQIDLRHYYDFP